MPLTPEEIERINKTYDERSVQHTNGFKLEGPGVWIKLRQKPLIAVIGFCTAVAAPPIIAYTRTVEKHTSEIVSIQKDINTMNDNIEKVRTDVRIILNAILVEKKERDERRKTDPMP
jgi:uncharacterized protein (UPF0335 family)